MTGKRVLVTNWLIYILLSLFMYYWENICMLDFSNPVRGFTLGEVILFFLGIFIITFIYFYLEKKRNNLKINYFLLISCALIFIYAFVVIMCIPSQKTFYVTNKLDPTITYVGTLSTSTDQRIYYIFFAFISLLFTYLFVDVFPKKYHFPKILNIGFYIACVVTLICMIYSYITEYNAYIGFIKNLFGYNVNYETTVHSWWNNRSNYSIFLLFMIFYALYVHHTNKKWWLYLIVAVLFTNLIFTLSKTNIPLSAILILGYLIARFFLSYKDNKKRNLIALAIIGGIILICLVTFITLFFVGPLANKLQNAFSKLFISHDGVNNTLQTRFWIYGHVIDILNNSSWVFGAGFGYFNALLAEYNACDYLSVGHNNTNMPHNFFLQVLGEGGVIYLAFVICLLVLFIYYLVKIVKKHKELVILESLFFAVMIVHLMLESSGPFVHSLPSVEGIIFCFLLWSPVYSIYYHDNNPFDNNEIIEQNKIYQNKINRYLTNPFSISNLIYFFLTPILFIVLGPLSSCLNNNSGWFIALLIILFIAFLVLPYIVQRIYNNKHELDKQYNNLNYYLLHIILPFLAIAVIEIAFARIYMSVFTNAFGIAMFVGFVNLVSYAAGFVLLPQLRNSGEFLYVFCANLNNFMISKNAKYIEEYLYQ